jgi:hypothetical protein
MFCLWVCNLRVICPRRCGHFIRYLFWYSYANWIELAQLGVKYIRIFASLAPVIQLFVIPRFFTLLGMYTMSLQNWLSVPQLCERVAGDGHPCHRAVTWLHMVPLWQRRRVCTVNMKLAGNHLFIHFRGLHCACYSVSHVVLTIVPEPMDE